jgi:hypothetical protein
MDEAKKSKQAPKKLPAQEKSPLEKAKAIFAIYEEQLSLNGIWVMPLDEDDEVNQELTILITEAGYNYDILPACERLYGSKLKQLAVYF